MKKSSCLALLVVCLPLQQTFAQNAPTLAESPAPTPPPAPAAPAATPPSNSATGLDGSTATTFDYIFNHKAGEGTMAKAGAEVASALADKIKAVDVLKTPGLDDPQVRARFETYLSLKEVPDDRIKDYFGKMTQISELLKGGDTMGAFKLLYTLADYRDIDAGISGELAQRVESFWNTDRTKNGLEQTNDQLRQKAETADRNADLISQEMQEQQSEQNLKSNNNNNNRRSAQNSQSNNTNNTNATNSPLNDSTADPVAAEAALMPQMSGSLQGHMELTEEYLKLLEARAKIKLNEMKENKMSDQDRTDFQDYIKTLYQTHRYYHVIIAAAFYRALFSDGDYPEDLANQAAASVGGTGRQFADSINQISKATGLNHRAAAAALNQLGVLAAGQQAQQAPPLSIADEVTSALEINSQVNEAIEVFKYKSDKGDIAAAAEQLQEAFVGNEYHPALQGLARADKEKVGDFLAKLDVLKNQLEVRDFEQVEGQIADIKKIASDFDSTKPMALVNDIKLESRLRLGKAKLLAQGGDLTDAMQEFQTAAEVWPGNPDLQSMSSGFFNTEDVVNQSTTEFDRLVKDEDYRGIFDKQVAFAPAVKGDAKREQQLKDALEKVGKAEMAEEKANMLAMNGDVDGAWETIELATKDWPDDIKLNKLLASLSSRSADFVSALNKAREAEDKKSLGYSLTWYVNAQSFYPPSQIAIEGIDRISKQILEPPASATAPTSFQAPVATPPSASTQASTAKLN